MSPRRRLPAAPLLVAALLTLLVALARVAPVAAATVEVRPTSLAGWGFAAEDSGGASGAPASGGFAGGPAAPPLGAGSFRMQTFAGSTARGYVLATPTFNGTRLDQITELRYSTYRASGASALAIALQLNVDYNIADANSAWQGRLVYEPYNSGTVSTGVWQQWNALAGPPSGSWWATGAPGNGVCPQANPCTLAELLGTFPNLGVHATLGALLFKAGSGGGWNDGFEGYVDALTIGVSGVSDSFDFEAEPNCADTGACYVSPSGNDANGGASPADALRTIQAAVDRAPAGGEVIVAPGSYAEAVSIPGAKDGLTLRGSGAAPAQVVISGPIGGSSGIRLPDAGTTGVTIANLRVQGFGNGGICATGTGADGLRVENVQVVGNSAGAGCLGGIYVNGPVEGVTITGSLADSNSSRGIVIWNGFKRNITITNNTVTNNNCCGIELQDGTASAVTITGNTVTGNADNGIGLVGLTSGAGPNLIANNTLTDNGRFGIELKLPAGSGLESGDGSIVVRDNIVRRVTPIEVQRPSELRDLGGIVVIRRGWVAGNGNIDIPSGVVLRGNTVSGYQQSNPGSASEGFGIVVEGSNHSVAGNTVSANDVGIQRQSGHQPYDPNNLAVDGNQADQADQYFGRGNAPLTCTAVGENSLSANGVDSRDVGAVTDGAVINLDTGEAFCGIQAAIDDADTTAGHTIAIPAGRYAEDLFVDKSITLRGPNAGVDPNGAEPRSPEAVIVPATSDPLAGVVIQVQAPGVTIDGLTVDGDNPDLTPGERDAAAGIANGLDGPVNGLTVRNSLIRSLDFSGVDLIGPIEGKPAVGNLIERNRFEDIGYPEPCVCETSGVGVLLSENAYADVRDNTMARVNVGVSVESFSLAGPPAEVRGNTIAAYAIGLASIDSYGEATPFTFAANTISAEPLPPAEEPVLLFSAGIVVDLLADAASVALVDNTVSGMVLGISMYDNSSAAPVTVSGGSVTGALFGLEIVNQFSSGPEAPTFEVSVDGLAISGAEAGLLIDAGAEADPARLVLAGGTTVSDGVDGALVFGENATLELGDTAFSGQSGDYIALVDSPRDIDGRQASFAGVRGADLDPAQYAAVQAKITDRNDDPALGLVILAGPTLLVSPASLDFSAVAGGADPAAQSVSVGNSPAASGSIGFWSLAIDYGGGPEGWLSCTPESGGAIAPGASVAVSCAPSIAGLGVGSYSASVTIEAAEPDETPAAGSPASVAVNLEITAAAAPLFSATPAAPALIDLGAAPVGVSTAARTIVVRNSGTAELALTPGLGGAAPGDYALTASAESLRLPPEAELTLSLVCTPSAEGSRPASLTIATNEPGEPVYAYGLACQGEAGAEPGPPIFGSAPLPGATVDFGTLAVGASASRTLTISNSGESALNLQAAAGVAAPFSVAPSPTQAASLAPGGSLAVTISCAPTAAGSFAAVLSYATNDPARPTASYTLRCAGEADEPPPPPQPIRLYLPLLLNDQAPAAPLPDLAVTAIEVTPAGQLRAGDPAEVRVTVTNRGGQAAGQFWVDLYINPASAPAAANQLWYDICALDPCQGAAWLLPGLAPGQSVTLSTAGGYSPAHTIWPGGFAAGSSQLYAYVDTFNPDVRAGGVAESDEANNRLAASIPAVQGGGAAPAQLSAGARQFPPRR